MEENMDIVSGSEYPANHLSNFHPHSFIFDDILCASMEGFLQSLKFENPEKQKEICLLVGKQAKYKGKKKKWWKTQTLYWKGEAYDRHGEAYRILLRNAFQALSTNEAFKKTLLDTGNANIKHSEGKSDPYKTILTEEEFCTLLMELREKLQKNC